MYPVIFQYNGLIISSYGLMLMFAFITCNYLLKKYLQSINVDSSIGDDLIFYAAIGGIIGAKIYYIIEGIPSGEAYYNIQGLILIFKGIFTFSFSTLTTGINQFGSGLVFLGGLIGGMISVSWYIRKNNLDWLTTSDWIAPYLALGHAIGRIGCFLVGDCYGKPCTLPWAVSFSNGLPPTTYASFKSNYPDVFHSHVEGFYDPGSIISVHPTQLYETFIYLLVFFLLYHIRKKSIIKGYTMILYLFFAGISRFLIEFFRVNPDYVYNLSGAQLISLIMIVSAFIMYRMNRKNYYNFQKNE